MTQDKSVSFALLLVAMTTIWLASIGCEARSQSIQDRQENVDDLTAELLTALNSAKVLIASLERSLTLLKIRDFKVVDFSKDFRYVNKRQDPLGLGGRFGRR